MEYFPALQYEQAAESAELHFEPNLREGVSLSDHKDLKQTTRK
jgi:hypothetical protein